MCGSTTVDCNHTNSRVASVGVSVSIIGGSRFTPPPQPSTLSLPPQGSAVFDFTGTGTEVWGNCNAPRAITLSALIYCLRCMVGQDIPLNQVSPAGGAWWG